MEHPPLRLLWAVHMFPFQHTPKCETFNSIAFSTQIYTGSFTRTCTLPHPCALYHTLLHACPISCLAAETRSQRTAPTSLIGLLQGVLISHLSSYITTCASAAVVCERSAAAVRRRADLGGHHRARVATAVDQPLLRAPMLSA
eukprot:1016669-Pleurochrysis_carterae.AAC.3